MSEQSLTLLLVAIIGMAGGLLTYVSSRKTQRLEKDRDVVTEWRGLYEGVQTEMGRKNREVDELRSEVNELRKRVSELEGRMIQQDAQHERERAEWAAERTRLYRQLYRYEHANDSTPPPPNKKVP